LLKRNIGFPEKGCYSIPIDGEECARAMRSNDERKLFSGLGLSQEVSGALAGVVFLPEADKMMPRLQTLRWGNLPVLSGQHEYDAVGGHPG